MHTRPSMFAFAAVLFLAGACSKKPAASGPQGQIRISTVAKVSADAHANSAAGDLCATFDLTPYSFDGSGNPVQAGSAVSFTTSSSSTPTDEIVGCTDGAANFSYTAPPGSDYASGSYNWAYLVSASHFADCASGQAIDPTTLDPAPAYFAPVSCSIGADTRLAIDYPVSLSSAAQTGYVDISAGVDATTQFVGCKETDLETTGGVTAEHFGESFSVDGIALPSAPPGLVGFTTTSTSNDASLVQYGGQTWSSDPINSGATLYDSAYTGQFTGGTLPSAIFQTFLANGDQSHQFGSGADGTCSGEWVDTRHPFCITTGSAPTTAAELADAFLYVPGQGYAAASLSGGTISVYSQLAPNSAGDYAGAGQSALLSQAAPGFSSSATAPNGSAGFNDGLATAAVGVPADATGFTGVYLDFANQGGFLVGETSAAGNGWARLAYSTGTGWKVGPFQSFASAGIPLGYGVQKSGCVTSNCPAATACASYQPDGTATCAATYAGTTTACNDGSAATYSDHCDGNGTCAGTPVVCSANTACMSYAPNGTATCTATPAAAGTPCGEDAQCNASGSCVLLCDPAATPFGGGSGTAGAPYLICSRTHLANVGTQLGATFKQMVDLDLGGSATPFASIPSSATTAEPSSGSAAAPGAGTAGVFTGTYDGNGKTISNLYFSSTQWSVGLFQVIGLGGVVKNLTLENATLTGGNRVGGIAGRMDGSISEVTISGGTFTSNASVGAIAGEMGDTSSSVFSIDQSQVIDATVYSTANDGTECDCAAAGIVGAIKHNPGQVTNSSTTNTSVTWSPTGSYQVQQFSYAGGIVGYFAGNNALLANCQVNGGTVTGYYDAGGLAGRHEAPGGVIRDSSTSATVRGVGGGSTGVGGVTGWVAGDFLRVFSTGSVTGQFNVGGFTGVHYSGAIQDCYSTSNVTATGTSGVSAGGFIGMFGYTVGPHPEKTATDCYAAGTVSYTGGGTSSIDIGGAVGLALQGTIERVYSAAPSITTSAGVMPAGFLFAGGSLATLGANYFLESGTFAAESGSTPAMGLTAPAMTVQGNFSTFDFTPGTGHWRMPSVNPGASLLSPVLAWQCGLNGVVCQ